MKITDFINQLNTVMRVEGNIHIVPFCVTFQNEEMSEIFDSLSELPPAPPLTENEVDRIVTSVFTELNDQVHELVSDSLVDVSRKRLDWVCDTLDFARCQEAARAAIDLDKESA